MHAYLLNVGLKTLASKNVIRPAFQNPQALISNLTSLPAADKCWRCSLVNCSSYGFTRTSLQTFFNSINVIFLMWLCCKETKCLFFSRKGMLDIKRSATFTNKWQSCESPTISDMNQIPKYLFSKAIAFWKGYCKSFDSMVENLYSFCADPENLGISRLPNLKGGTSVFFHCQNNSSLLLLLVWSLFLWYSIFWVDFLCSVLSSWSILVYA